MSFENQTIEDLYEQLTKVKRERDAKGPEHPDYKLADEMVRSIKKAIKDIV